MCIRDSPDPADCGSPHGGTDSHSPAAMLYSATDGGTDGNTDPWSLRALHAGPSIDRNAGAAYGGSDGNRNPTTDSDQRLNPRGDEGLSNVH